MRFNYVRDTRPDVFERMWPMRLPEHLRTPLAALTTAAVVVASWWIMESQQVEQARAELATERSRAIASRIAVARVRLRRDDVKSLLADDRQVRLIRRSGAWIASELADIGNHVPDHAWLTSINRVNRGFELDGGAVGLDGLSETLASLTSSGAARNPTLVRASRDNTDAGLVTFQLHSGGFEP